MASTIEEISRTRFLTKKAARVAIATLSWPALELRRRSSRHDNSVRVLTYHRFGEGGRDPFCLPLDSFERQMAWLASGPRAVSLPAFLQHLRGERRVSPESVLVTIDDGHGSVYSDAWPVLRRYRIPAVVFAIAGEVGNRGRMDWSALRELQAAGVEIGAHGFRHRSMAGLTAVDAASEACRSRAILANELGRPVRTFAYPFGTWSDVDDVAENAIRQAGYECAFTAQHGAVASGAPAFKLPRIKVERGDPEWLFPRLCSGALDGYGWVDRRLYRLQQLPKTRAAG